MKVDIHDLLPEEISDESAYHLVTFLMNLATALESCYFAQIHRHIADTTEPCSPDDLLVDSCDDDYPF